MSERAIDVFEHYQGAIDWTAVRASGVTTAIIKLTNGANVAGPPGDHYVDGARSAGVRPGGYAYALGGDPIAQANVFAAELQRLGAIGIAPALDYEDPSLPGGTAAADWVMLFFVHLKARIPALNKVLLYSSGSELTAINAGNIRVPGLEILIWDAEYWTNDGTEHPVRYYTGPVAIHQFTSTGHVPGIAGNVDLDTINADITTQGDDLSAEDTAILKEIRNQITGSPDLNQFPGWESFANPKVKMTVTDFVRAIDKNIVTQGAQISALAAAVAAATTSPSITLDAITKVVDAAVAQHIQITGTVDIHATPTTPAV